VNLKPAGDTYPNDDGKSLVRGLAALVVVIAHAIQVFIVRVVGSDAMIAKISGQMAKQAVLVFFIVSGYLITQSIIKNVERNSGRFDAIQFATARIARIYPPLVFAITLCLVFYFTLSFADLPGGNSVAASPLGLPGDLYAARLWFEISSSDVQDVIFMNNGMLQVNGPLWSLCIEWRIYVVAAFFTMALYSKRWPSRIIWILMLWVFARKLGNTNESSYFFLLMWAMGGCVALAEASRFNFQFLRNSAVRLLLICCVCIASIFCPALLLPDGTADPALDYAFQFLMCLMWLGILFPSRQIAIAPIRKLMSRIGDFDLAPEKRTS
jgi:peptidoglycan/LPS O-acetylase OafA/YrhL